MVEALLRLGAGTKADGRDELNALAHTATRSGYAGCTLAFIAAGFDFQDRGYGGQTILHEALSCKTSRGRFETARYILGQEGGRSIVNSKDLCGSGPIHYLVANSQSSNSHRLEMVKLLLLCGADIQAKNYSGYTPAHILAGSDDIDSMGELIRAGFDINTKSPDGVTALHRAACCQAKMVKYLLELEGGRLSINARNAHGKTPLHLAVEIDYEKVVKLLLRNGADTDIEDEQGETPSLIAYRRRDEHVVKAFIDAGVNLSLGDMPRMRP